MLYINPHFDYLCAEKLELRVNFGFTKPIKLFINES